MGSRSLAVAGSRCASSSPADELLEATDRGGGSRGSVSRSGSSGRSALAALMLARRARLWNASPPMLHTAHGWWLEEAGRSSPAGRSRTTSRPTLAIVGGGYTGMWTAWHLLQAAPGVRVALLEAELMRAWAERAQRRLLRVALDAGGTLRRRLGDAGALALLEASRGNVRGDRPLVPGAGGGRLVPASALSAGARPPAERSGAAKAEAAVALGGPSGSARNAGEVRARCGSPGLRGGIMIPPTRPRCSQRGWPWGCASGCSTAAPSSSSARACAPWATMAAGSP